MKKVKNRTYCVLLLVLILVLGIGVYTYRLSRNGGHWAAQAYNKTVYSGGVLAVGTVYDRNGTVLAAIDADGNRIFAADAAIRTATLHLVGDTSGNIGTGALSAFASRLSGYDFINGTYSLNGTGGEVNLTIDAALCKTAYEALAGRKGAVAVMNYETGELLCSVSSMSYDPENPPAIREGDEKYEGVYLNRVMSVTYTPGSTFKLVTAAAAIEEIDDIYERVFECTGHLSVEGDSVSCTGVHGALTFEDALAVSCNCVFAQLALELGGDILSDYAAQFGLLERHSIDGIQTAAGSYTVAEQGTVELAWSGVGQYNDLINPAAMLRFVGAIANDGVAVEMHVLEKQRLLAVGGTSRILKTETAQALSLMMNYNVAHTYGTENFPGLALYAKSGTAEVGGDKKPHAWFVGFIKNENTPLAFVVVVENGGGGSAVAGKIANTVLQAAVSE